MNTLLKLTNINELTAELTEKILDVNLDGIFDQVLGRFHNQFEEMLESSKAYEDTTRRMTKWIKEVLIVDALPKVEEVLSSKACDGISKSLLMEKLQEKVISFWQALGAQMLVKRLIDARKRL